MRTTRAMVVPKVGGSFEMIERNAIAAMNEIYPFDDAQAAYDRMMSGKARFHVVLSMQA
jgi:D-arabinose 1-dehydrogenase-like Zn-dependent alcohol dehydrogenase